MKRAIYEEWLRRLESGEIKQGRTYLGRFDGSRCCLGVLCDVVGLEYEVDTENLDNPVLNYTDGRDISDGSIPRWKAKELGITPDGDPSDGTEALSQLNDEGYPFSEIAQILRLNHLKYIDKIED